MSSYTNPDAPPPADGSGYYGGSDLLSTLVQVGGAVYNARQERKNTKDTIKANKEMAEYAYQKDLDMWHMMNAYNDPSAAMARYEAAGLNPNMIYGAGGSAGNATSSPKYSPPEINYRGMPGVVDVPSVISAYQNFSLRQAQINNVKAQTKAVETKTANEDLKGLLFDMQGKTALQKYNQMEKTNPYSAEIAANQARLSGMKLTRESLEQEGIDSSNFLKDIEMKYRESTLNDRVDLVKAKRENEQAQLLFNQYKAQWAKMGITSSDNIAFRAIARMFAESGFGITDLIKVNKPPDWTRDDYKPTRKPYVKY